MQTLFGNHIDDCVSIAVQSSLFKDVKFDGVISGINKGPNLGTDIIFSGTCAAARQACMYRIPGVALSLDSNSKNYLDDSTFNYELLADFVSKNLEKILEISKKTDFKSFVNINAPSVEKYNGVKYCSSLCIRDYNDSIEITEKEKDFYTTKFIFGMGKTLWNCECPSEVDYNANKVDVKMPEGKLHALFIPCIEPGGTIPFFPVTSEDLKYRL